MKNLKHQAGFTLIELLVVIAIISLLSSVIFSSLSTARTKARDAKRLSEMHQVQLALDLYYHSNNATYPDGDGDGSGTWDVGNQTLPFLTTGGVSRLGSFLPNPPRDPTATGNFAGYKYYRYPAGYSAGCPTARGAYYILIADMENNVRSPGFACAGYSPNASTTQWATGAFENP